MPFMPVLSLLWGNQWTRLAIVAVLCFGTGWVRGFDAVPRPDIAAITKNAQDGRDAEWTRKLAQKERDHETELAAAIAERDSTPVLAADMDVERLCQSSAQCRDKSGKRR